MRYIKLYEQFRLILESEAIDLKSLGFTDEDIQLIEDMKKDGNKVSMLGNVAKEVFYETMPGGNPPKTSKKDFRSFYLENISKFDNFWKAKGVDSGVVKYWNRPKNEEHQEYIQLPLAYSELVLGFNFEYKVENLDCKSIVLSGGEDPFLGNPKARYKLYSFIMKGGYWWNEENHEFWENNNQVVDTTQLKSPSGKFGKKGEMITKDKEEPVSGCYWNTGYLTEETPKQFAKDMESKTPEERDELWAESTEKFLTQPTSKMIVVYRNKEGKNLILDGGHRVFLANWLNKTRGKSISLSVLVITEVSEK
jgi:hypothetical protein